MGIKLNAPRKLNTPAQRDATLPIIIVGNGPVGGHVLQELTRLGAQSPILQFGKEQRLPYDRVALSSLLQGRVTAETLSVPQASLPNVTYHHGTGISQINPADQTVTDQAGNAYPYGTLILALGSSPHVPNIPGKELSGVFTFRDFEDVEKLRSRHFRSTHCVVLGGGLLGIEAAIGMSRYGTRVTLIHHAPFLMNKQLDEQTSSRLYKQLTNSGMEVLLGNTITSITGRDRVESVHLRDGRILECDTVLFSTGIRPNIDLARSAGLAVGLGIKIDSNLETSIPNIFAVGECAEYRGETYGLVAPGLEQAANLAKQLTGSRITYAGSVMASSLKVSDLPVHSVGTVSDYGPAMMDCVLRHTTEDHDRLITLYRGHIVGAAGVGDWPEFGRLREALKSRTRVLPWQRLRFETHGRLFGDTSTALPDTAILCNCRSITVGEVRSQFEPGMSTQQLCEASGASQVCGSCEPLVAQVAETKSETKPVSRLPMIAGLVALIYGALFWLLPAFPVQQSVEASEIPKLWSNTVARQWTGYTLLALVTMSMVVSAVKRGPGKWAKAFNSARNIHLVLTVSMAMLLLIHTGLQNSDNLNFALLSCAIALIFLGGVTSVLVALEPRYPSLTLKTWKRRLAGFHLYVAWPLPVLLGFHIVSVYYF